jgi:FkbM family methyltransferase
MTAATAERPFAGAHRTVTVGAARFRVCDDKPTFWDRAEDGRWEPGTVAAVEALVGPRTVFLDIGAWVGPLTLIAAARGARVVAVEADPRALALLEANLAANPDLAGSVTVVGRAASTSATPVRMGAPRKPGDSMSSVLLAGAPGGWTADPASPGELVTIAAVGDDERLVVKLDIEGGEYELLPELVRALPEAADALLVAFHPKELARAGRSPAEVAAGTQACASALDGWSGQALETAHGNRADPFAIAATQDVTILLRRTPLPIPNSRAQKSGCQA